MRSLERKFNIVKISTNVSTFLPRFTLGKMLDKEQWEQVIEYMKAAKGFDSFLLDRV